MIKSIRALAFTFILVAAALFSPAAKAQTVIDHLPYTINTKGLYVLNSDLSSTQTGGSLIKVNASNVTIDFQGHYIAGSVGNTSQSTAGIRATEQSNLTIKNGTIAYCYEGIYINGNGTSTTNAVDAQIDNMRVTYCYFIGIYVSYCSTTRVTNCQVSQTGYSGATYADGIATDGAGTAISNNFVNVVTATNAIGIYAAGYNASTGGSFIRQNTVSIVKTGVYGGKYQDNLTSGCTTAYTGGTDAGGNN